MKKTAIAIAVALAGFATTAQAAPKDDTWYAGGKLGWSEYHSTATNPSLQNTGSTKNVQLGAGAYGGYQVNPYVGFEMGYDWLGRMAYQGSSNGAFKAQGIQLTTKLNYPVMNDVDVYTRLGGMVWRADSNLNYGAAGRAKNNDTGVSPVFAGGVEWAVTPDIATRVEYQWINRIGDRDTLKARPDNGMLSVGVSYRFGQHETAPVIAPAPAPAPVPAPEVETKHFTLKSDVLFTFGKSTLKAEGQQALDQLYNQLSSLDPTDGSVVVLGFTDRIGSEQFNLRLSEQRAQSVVDYLVAKGIPADKISARGMGKADPITGNTCDNVAPRAKLIECLAPDRRVEIQVKGIKEVVVQPAA